MHPKTNARVLLRWILGLFFIVAGANHFRSPEIYLTMIPPVLPAPELLNFIAGAAEILGGLGILIDYVRKPAAWGLIALLVAIFPANIHVAWNGWDAISLPRWVLWARLPFQFIFIAAVYWACLTKPKINPII